MSDDTVLCPTCGWSGEPSDDGAGEFTCPVCAEDAEFVD